MKKVFFADNTREYFTRSRWIAVQYAYNITPRHSLYDYATDENGYHPYQDKYNPENGNSLIYFRYNGRKYALEQFYPIGGVVFGGVPPMFIDDDGKLTVIGTIDGDGDLYRPLYAEWDEYCERVRVYTQVNEYGHSYW